MSLTDEITYTIESKHTPFFASYKFIAAMTAAFVTQVHSWFHLWSDLPYYPSKLMQKLYKNSVW